MSKIKFLSSRAGYDLAAENYDKKEKYLNSFEQGKTVPLFEDVNGKKILDVGAGTGRLAVELAKKGAIVTALDVSEQMLKILQRKNKKIITALGDAESMPFADEEFDLVAAEFLIVHLKNPKRFFDEAYRVLKNRGRLLITNINQKDPPEINTKDGKIKIESFYHRPDRIIEILKSLAFEIEKEIFIKEDDVWINQIIVARK